MRKYFYPGFTLIELLIVVAIIAILAAIAVPNFLEAQVRAKVTRCKNDMRSLATAMEAYRIDNSKYPPDVFAGFVGMTGGQLVPYRLSTPIAYITSIPKNVFPSLQSNLTQDQRTEYSYVSEAWKILNEQSPPGGGPFWNVPAGLWDKVKGTPKMWAFSSIGPDRIPNLGEWSLYGQELHECWKGGINNQGPGCLYDPTNGTISAGDIARTGP